MKTIVLSLIASVWLLSANEQGLVGDWALWTSPILTAIALLLTLHITGGVQND